MRPETFGVSVLAVCVIISTASCHSASAEEWRAIQRDLAGLKGELVAANARHADDERKYADAERQIKDLQARLNALGNELSARPMSASATTAPASTTTMACVYGRATSGDCNAPFTGVGIGGGAASVSELPTHKAKKWILIILAHDFNRTFRVAETRAGDVPLPEDCPWRCRLSSVRVLNAPDANAAKLISRDVRCSNDGWRTAIGTSGTYGYEEESGGLDLFYDHPVSNRISVFFVARDTAKLADGTFPPELP
jgi:hypothetical protein